MLVKIREITDAGTLFFSFFVSLFRKDGGLIPIPSPGVENLNLIAGVENFPLLYINTYYSCYLFRPG